MSDEAIENSKKTCQKCGTQNDIDSRFCENCGCEFKTESIDDISSKDIITHSNVQASDNSVYCPDCGTKNVAGNKFCCNCGYNLTNDKKLNNTKNHNSLFKSLFIGIISAAIILGAFAGFIYYEDIQASKEPYSTTWTFEDTDTHVNAAYNDNYEVVNVDLTIDEIIEQWQIDEIGSNITEIKIICKTYDGLKKEFTFKDITLNPGEKIKGRYTMESATLKDFVMVKSLLQGDVTISYSQPLEMNSQKRKKLKQAYYQRKEEQRKAEEAANALNAFGSLMLLNSMF